MQYPLDLRFKLFALATQISLTDGSSNALLYIKQKMFKFKEHIEVFRDSKQGEKLFDIKADRIIDFSACYSFTSPGGTNFGAVRRKGAKSLWRASYDVIEDGQVDMTISEEHPWKKVWEGLAGEIPIVGFVVALLLNPSYLVKSPDGTPLMRVTKKAAVFEGKFVIDKLAEISPDDELRALLSLIMVVVLERQRG